MELHSLIKVAQETTLLKISEKAASKIVGVVDRVVQPDGAGWPHQGQTGHHAARI